MIEKNNIKSGEVNTNKSNEQNDFYSFENTKNIISDTNNTELNNINNIKNDDTIDLSNLEIQKDNIKKVQFGTDGREIKDKKHYHINYRKIFILSFVTIIISSLISGLFYIYNSYIKNYTITNTGRQTTISNSIIQIKNTINKYLYSDHNAYNDIDLIGDKGNINLDRLINSDTSYIQKKEILNNSVVTLSNDILTTHNTLNEIKKHITKNGFFPEEVGEIILNKQQISSIQNSLLSLEAIKFNSAINVFSYLDTFIESLSKSIKISKDTIKENTQDIIQRGEKDINLYLRNCYLNPFEINYKCNTINDFEKHYKMVNDQYFDTNFFKELINYTDSKLEQSQLPSFSITFKEFDQNKNEITFDININTFKQDEIELAKNGILSPHIFIYTSLINNLKQSKFIIGENISTKNLKINTNTINLGSTEFIVHNSSKSFTLPIQKENEREIFDFINNN